ncbi:hypothetical protein [Thiorhodovibrio frisius]|uniref:hypothetical protein n=1 Tax=Thiorhodovibrio frisius TaxID=631362 RepID=UPI00117D9DF9|nr:hypothetical protein [Thiorhodovibrio frisius]
MSFLGFNIASLAECGDVIAQSDLPDYSGAVVDCNMAYGVDFVTKATTIGISDFKDRLREHGHLTLCPAVKSSLDNYWLSENDIELQNRYNRTSIT